MMAGYVLNVIHFLEGFNRLNTRKIEHVRDKQKSMFDGDRT